MAKTIKFYVVWKGRDTGIFTNWAACKKQVSGFKGAKHKSFETRAEAEVAFHSDVASTTKTPSKKSKPSKLPTTKKKPTANIVKTYTAEEISLIKVDTKIYTDGGCVPNPGKAGSGIAIYRNDTLAELWSGLYNAKGTNNIAELNGLHQSLILAGEEISKGKSVAIFCDSKYSIQAVTQWAIKWHKNGWRKSGGEIKNLELIKEMFTLHQSIKDEVQVLHVNGHVGVEGNELADRMSMIAIDTKEVAFTRYRGDLNVKAILAMRAGQ